MGAWYDERAACEGEAYGCLCTSPLQALSIMSNDAGSILYIFFPKLFADLM